MTKDEILEVIAREIEGQGTNVDAGCVLPKILKEIMELGSKESKSVVIEAENEEVEIEHEDAESSTYIVPKLTVENIAAILSALDADKNVKIYAESEDEESYYSVAFAKEGKVVLVKGDIIITYTQYELTVTRTIKEL